MSCVARAQRSTPRSSSSRQRPAPSSPSTRTSQCRRSRGCARSPQCRVYSLIIAHCSCEYTYMHSIMYSYFVRCVQSHLFRQILIALYIPCAIIVTIVLMVVIASLWTIDDHRQNTTLYSHCFLSLSSCIQAHSRCCVCVANSVQYIILGSMNASLFVSSIIDSTCSFSYSLVFAIS